MDKPVKIVLGVLFAILLVGVIFFTLNDNPETQLTSSVTRPNSENSAQDSTATDPSDNVEGNYFEYSEDAIQEAHEEYDNVVLFFHAIWCPTCRQLDKELAESSGQLDENIAVIKTDFDTDNELKEKYGVVVQHTLVQVDKSGEEINKLVGGNINEINDLVK